MPRYTITMAMTLKITKAITLRAKDEETAQGRVHTMLEDTHFGTLSWEVHDDKSPEGWNEEEYDTVIDYIVEEDA